METAPHYLKAGDFLNELQGSVALVNSDFNVPLTSEGKVADDYRIKKAAPFIIKLINNGVTPLLATHLGRPKGYDSSLTLDEITGALSQTIGREVEIIRFEPQTKTYPNLSKEHIKDIFKSGKVAMLDNTRFHPDQRDNKGGLAKILSEVVDIAMQNSFGTAHSLEDTNNFIHEFVPGLAGDLLDEEIQEHRKIKEPNSPYVVIVGGDKVYDSLTIMRKLFWAEKTTYATNKSNYKLNLDIKKRLIDCMLVGGHLMYAFIYATSKTIEQDKDILNDLPPEKRKSLRGLIGIRLKGYEPTDEEVELAKGLIRLYNRFQFKYENKDECLPDKELILPIDFTVLRKGDKHESVEIEGLLDGDEVVDIGKKSQELYEEIIKKARTIVWNGPLGLNDEKYTIGTRKLVDAINNNKGSVKEIGGGSTNYVTFAYEDYLGKALEVGFRSTGGGSTLLEIASDSLMTISLIMSRQKLLEGRYGDRFEMLRTAAVKKIA